MDQLIALKNREVQLTSQFRVLPILPTKRVVNIHFIVTEKGFEHKIGQQRNENKLQLPFASSTRKGCMAVLRVSSKQARAKSQGEAETIEVKIRK